MDTSPIDSWKRLAALIEEHADESWLFRGESADGFTLKPAAGRVSSDIGSARKKQYEEAHEIEALELFKREVRPHLGHQPESELEWLAIAQHHGMATRLLDWSESFLVAAFFASVNAGARRRSGVVYAVRGIAKAAKADQKNPFAMKSVRLYRPPHITSRIPAQRSVFTVHPDPTADFSAPSLKKWTIEPDACARIKHILDACGINESSLFPGIDGLSRHIRWRYKWAKFREEPDD